MLPERSLSWSRGSSTFPPRQVSFGTLERPRWRLWRPAAARRLCRTARALVRRPRHGLRPYFPENPAKPQNMDLTFPKVPQHTRRQKNPLQLEQLMTCSFSTSSFVHSTDAISEDTHNRTDRLVRRKPHRLEKKQTDVRGRHTDR